MFDAEPIMLDSGHNHETGSKGSKDRRDRRACPRGAMPVMSSCHHVIMSISCPHHVHIMSMSCPHHVHDVHHHDGRLSVTTMAPRITR